MRSCGELSFGYKRKVARSDWETVYKKLALFQKENDSDWGRSRCVEAAAALARAGLGGRGVTEMAVTAVNPTLGGGASNPAAFTIYAYATCLPMTLK